MARPRLGLGLGDPRSENGFNDANMRFARQLGCTDVILEVPYDLSDAPNPDSVLDGMQRWVLVRRGPRTRAGTGASTRPIHLRYRKLPP